jgi:hypothetical protein
MEVMYGTKKVSLLLPFHARVEPLLYARHPAGCSLTSCHVPGPEPKVGTQMWVRWGLCPWPRLLREPIGLTCPHIPTKCSHGPGVAEWCPVTHPAHPRPPQLCPFPQAREQTSARLHSCAPPSGVGETRQGLGRTAGGKLPPLVGSPWEKFFPLPSPCPSTCGSRGTEEEGGGEQILLLTSGASEATSGPWPGESKDRNEGKQWAAALPSFSAFCIGPARSQMWTKPVFCPHQPTASWGFYTHLRTVVTKHSSASSLSLQGTEEETEAQGGKRTL